MTVRPAKTQISLGIRPVWSESSLSAWRNLGSLATQWAQSEDSDQTGRVSRLIWVFARRRLTLLVLSCRGSYMEGDADGFPQVSNARYFNLLILDCSIVRYPVILHSCSDCMWEWSAIGSTGSPLTQRYDVNRTLQIQKNIARLETCFFFFYSPKLSKKSHCFSFCRCTLSTAKDARKSAFGLLLALLCILTFSAANIAENVLLLRNSLL